MQVVLADGTRFERVIVSEPPLDATYGGVFGGFGDTHRQFVRGFTAYRWFVNDREVSREEFQRIYKEKTGAT